MRWSGIFPTANVAAVEMALLLIGILVFVNWIRVHMGHSKWRFILLMLGISSGFFCAFLLSLTGSRGGVLAALVALLLLSVSGSIYRLHCCLLIILIFVFQFVSPFASRFSSITVDESVLNRFVVWKRTLALVADHPWSGVGLNNVMPLLDRWYLPDRLQGQLATPLNEGLMMVASWGIPVFAIVCVVVCALVIVGWRSSVRGSAWGALGLAAITTHIVAGMFQGHVFAWWQSQLGFMLGVFLIIVSSLPEDWKIQSMRWAVGIGLALAVLVSALASLFGESTWHTHRFDDEFIATPGLRARGRFVVVYCPDDAPRGVLRKWCDRRRQEGISLCLLGKIKDPRWFNNVGSISRELDSVPPLLLAWGESASAFWNSGRAIEMRGWNVRLTDPIGPLVSVGILPGATNVCVRVARFAPFVDVDYLVRESRRIGFSSIEVVGGSTSAWWTVEP